MPLSCTCFEWDGEGVFWYVPDDFTRLAHNEKKAMLLM